MRKLLYCLGLLSLLISLPVFAQWLPASPTFVRGSQNNLAEIDVPIPAGGLLAFEGLTVDITYDGAIFQPLALTFLPAAGDAYIDFGSSLISTPTPAGCAPTCTDVVVGISLVANTNAPGYGLDGVDVPGPGIFLRARASFSVLQAAALGPTTVLASFDDGKGITGNLPVQATIVAVPEPQVWAAMLTGLTLMIGVGAVRRRSTNSAVHS